MTREETIKLIWNLLEHRIRYYVMDDPVIGDIEYDMLEKKALKSAEEHGIETCLSTMVGANMELPSMQSAYTKIIGQGKRKEQL